MLKGLEISEIRLKDIGLKTSDFRIDAEYFTGKFAQYCRLMEKCGFTCFAREAQRVVKGAFDITADKFRESGIPFVRISNLRNMEIDTSSIVYIDADVHAEYLASKLRRGDIVLSKTAYAAASIVTLPVCNTSQDTIAISLNSNSRIDPYFTVVYLNTKYGLFLMEYLFTGNIQKHFNLTECKTKLPIPIFSAKFQGEVRKLFEQALVARCGADKIYHGTEQSLLTELGFDGWMPTEESVSVKNCSDFMSAGRFDAEYFQPKYDELFALLAKCKVRVLGGKDGLVDIKRSIEPGSDAYSDKGIPFVRIADFTEMGVASPEIHIPPELCSDSPRPKKDTILLSKDGSVGIAYKVEEDLDVVTSSGILYLTVKDNAVLPDYLTLVLNSKIVRLQAERSAGGSIIQHWKQSEIENVSIPILPMSSQQKITAKVRESFALRAESKRLLDLAKHAVEVAIERGEEKAMEVLGEY